MIRFAKVALANATIAKAIIAIATIARAKTASDTIAGNRTGGDAIASTVTAKMITKTTIAGENEVKLEGMGVDTQNEIEIAIRIEKETRNEDVASKGEVATSTRITAPISSEVDSSLQPTNQAK